MWAVWLLVARLRASARARPRGQFDAIWQLTMLAGALIMVALVLKTLWPAIASLINSLGTALNSQNTQVG